MHCCSVKLFLLLKISFDLNAWLNYHAHLFHLSDIILIIFLIMFKYNFQLKKKIHIQCSNVNFHYQSHHQSLIKRLISIKFIFIISFLTPFLS